MEKTSSTRIIKFPSNEEMAIAFEAYAMAVGKVAHAWNYLHEKLADLFVSVMNMDADRHLALGVWYSSNSDLSQRNMLLGAIKASDVNRWKPRLPKARPDLEWLVTTANGLSERRNDAIHAPCSIAIGADADGRTVMAASYFSGHTRARNLLGKNLLVEFDWLERYAEELSRFTSKATTALGAVNYPWPNRPAAPDRKPKRNLPNQHPLPLPK